MDLPTIWFLILGVLLAGYAMLDGFDLGVGILHPLCRTDEERRIAMNSIGPLWDGNEVWLVTFGGALFAAFPEAYATAFSAFYLPFMLLLFCLIFRAVSLEFRSKVHANLWRRAWDWAFFASSAGAALLFGVAVGNAVVGLPLDPRGRFAGSLGDLIGIVPLLTGALTVALFSFHGALFLHLKTEGALQERLRGWLGTTFGVFLLLYLLTTVVTLVEVPRAVETLRARPWLWLVPTLSILAIANVPRALFLQKSAGWAFLSSCLLIVSLVGLLGIALYPSIVPATDPERSLSLADAASSQGTLRTMLWIAGLGFPCVLSYTAIIYWTFRGKVQLGEHSY